MWRVATGEYLSCLRHHRDIITSLVFRPVSDPQTGLILYSGSADRMVKMWNMTELAYMDSLFGHQEGVVAMDAFMKERALSVGGRDRSIRYWKILEESQVIFQADTLHAGSLDALALLSENHFITGSDQGQLALWHLARKKPLFTLPHAHGEGNGIHAVGTLRNSDLFASGSCDGQVRLWKVSEALDSFKALYEVPLEGFINCLCFTRLEDPSDEVRLVAGTGQEPRLGRWNVLKSAQNSLLCFDFTRSTSETEPMDESPPTRSLLLLKNLPSDPATDGDDSDEEENDEENYDNDNDNGDDEDDI